MLGNLSQPWHLVPLSLRLANELIISITQYSCMRLCGNGRVSVSGRTRRCTQGEGKETLWNVRLTDSEHTQVQQWPELSLRADSERTDFYYCAEAEASGHFYSKEWKRGLLNALFPPPSATSGYSGYRWQHISWPVTLILLPWTVTWEYPDSGAGTNGDTSERILSGSACQLFGIWAFIWNDVSCPCLVIIHSYFPSQLSQCLRECLSMTSAMRLCTTTDYRLLKIN